jgi:hypothetical protein
MSYSPTITTRPTTHTRPARLFPPVPGAHNVNLTGVFPSGPLLDAVQHQDVHSYYYGTIDTSASNDLPLLIDFIERALEEYDHVIFDSGPLLMVSDSIAPAVSIYHREVRGGAAPAWRNHWKGPRLGSGMLRASVQP